MYTVRFIASLLLFSLVCSDLVRARPIRFGISVNPNLPGQGALHTELVDGLRYSMDMLNSFPQDKRRLNRDNDTFTMELFVMTHGTNKTLFLQNYAQMAANSSIDYVLSPPPSASFWAVDAMRLVRTYGRQVLFGPVDSRDSWYEIDGVGAPTSTRHLMLSGIPYLVNAGAKTMSIVYANEAFQRESCEGLQNQVRYNKISVVNSTLVPHANSLSDSLIYNLTQAMDSVVSQSADVVVLCLHKASLEWSMGYFREKNYSPGAIMTTSFFQPFTDPTLAYYMMSFSNMPPEDSGFPEIDLWGSVRGLYSNYRAKYGTNPGTMTMNALLTVQAFYQAFIGAGTANDSVVYYEIHRSNFDSIVGPVLYGIDNRNRLDAVLIQKTADREIVVGPILGTNGRFIYPFPAWDLRTERYRWGSTVDIVSVIIISITTISLIAVVPGLLYIWNTRAAKMSSRVFLLVSLLASIITEMGLLAWLPGLTTDHSCRARILVIGPFGVLVLCSLIVKGWRIIAIFSIRDLKPFGISDKKLGLILSSIMLLTYIIPILMVSLGDIGVAVNVVNEYEPALNFLSCRYNQSFEIMRIIGLSLGGLIILAGIVIIGGIRKKITQSKARAYDESTPLFYAVWAVLLVYSVVVVVQYVVPIENQDIASIIMVIFVSAGLIFLNAFVLGRVFLQSYKGVSSITGSGSSQLGSFSGSGTFGGVASNLQKKSSNEV